MILEQKCIQYGFGSMYLQCNGGVSGKNTRYIYVLLKFDTLIKTLFSCISYQQAWQQQTMFLIINYKKHVDYICSNKYSSLKGEKWTRVESTAVNYLIGLLILATNSNRKCKI